MKSDNEGFSHEKEEEVEPTLPQGSSSPPKTPSFDLEDALIVEFTKHCRSLEDSPPGYEYQTPIAFVSIGGGREFFKVNGHYASPFFCLLSEVIRTYTAVDKNCLMTLTHIWTEAHLYPTEMHKPATSQSNRDVSAILSACRRFKAAVPEHNYFIMIQRPNDGKIEVYTGGSEMTEDGNRYVPLYSLLCSWILAEGRLDTPTVMRMLNSPQTNVLNGALNSEMHGVESAMAIFNKILNGS